MVKFGKHLFLLLFGLLLAATLAEIRPVPVTAATDTVDIVLHKRLFDKHSPTVQINNGQSTPAFGQTSRPLNGVTFTVYDVTPEFWTYVHKRGVTVERAQRYFAQKSVSGTVMSQQVTQNGGLATFRHLPLRSGGKYAVYLFKETGTPAGILSQSQNLVVVLPATHNGQVRRRLDLFPKNVLTSGTPGVTKRVVAKRTSFGYGEQIPYQITTKIPADIGALRTFSLSDQADAGLYLLGKPTVKLNGRVLPADAGWYRLTATAHGFKLAFTVSRIMAAANQGLTVAYTMAIARGVPADQPLLNETIVTPGGHTPQHSFVGVTTGGKRFIKVAAKHSARRLAGAHFVVENTEGAYLHRTKTGWAWSAQLSTAYQLISDQGGAFAIQGLAPGRYRLVELQAPAGYIKNTHAIPFSITAGTYSKTTPYRVINVPQSHRSGLLPKTGEQIAGWLIIIGFTLIGLVAAIRLKTKIWGK